MNINVNIGDTFTSRGGSKFTVTSKAANGGFTITRDSTGKSVKITKSILSNTLERAKAGECFKYQANKTKGGISYTVAIESGVAFALRYFLERDDKNRQYVSKQDAFKATQ
jgi:hypothetical protein